MGLRDLFRLDIGARSGRDMPRPARWAHIGIWTFRMALLPNPCVPTHVLCFVFAQQARRCVLLPQQVSRCLPLISIGHWDRPVGTPVFVLVRYRSLDREVALRPS